MNLIKYISSILFISLFYGCGPSGDLSENVDFSLTNVGLTTVTVERGPVLMATVKDANGLIATNIKFGTSNIYTFSIAPKFPISVSGGYIDVNYNSILDENDTKLDINMSSYSNVISPLTTLVGDIDNNSTVYDYLVTNYDLNKSQIFDFVPSKTSKDIIILSNAIYKYLRTNDTFSSANINESISDVNTLYTSGSFTDITDLQELSVALETQVMDDIGIATLTNSDLTDINNLILSNLYPAILILDNSSFARVKSKDDNISDIWNMSLNIEANQTIDNFDIAIHILKSTGTIGNIVIKGVSIANNEITQVSSLTFFGKQGSNTASTSYPSQHSMTQNAVLLSDNKLLLNLGYIIENQTVVDSSKFSDPANYTIKMYISKLDVNASSITSSEPIQTGYNSYYDFEIGSQKIDGTLEIQ